MRPRTTRTALAALTVSLAAAACGDSSTSSATTVAPTSAAPATSAAVTSTTAAIEGQRDPIDELVTISGGRLHIRCTGAGDATVLLISGWTQDADAWSQVEPVIAEHARVCTYDRPGLGTSDDPATTQTFETQAADLHALLDEVGEAGPFVVVGHSFGGAEAVMFASTYADEVAGLMLVDASPTDWPETVCSVPAYAGACEIMRTPSPAGEMLDVFPAFAQVAAITTLGDLPMAILTAAHRSPDGLTPDELARVEAIWLAGTERWAALSTASHVVTVEDTGHAIQDDQPTVVINEVLALVP